MNEYELIDNCRIMLNAAEVCMNHEDHKGYCRQFSYLLNHLMEELVGSAPGKPDKPLPERSKYETL